MRRIKPNKKFIYLDHAATTPLDPKVEQEMRLFWSEKFQNPSSIYGGGLETRKAVENARKHIADILHCSSSEVVFTPGGTASDNLAVLGIARAYAGGGKKHIIVSSIEHEAVLEPARQLEKDGFSVTFLKIDKNGLVDPRDVKKALRPDTIFVSVMYANNEIGTIQPIREIAKTIRDFRKIRNPQSARLAETASRGWAIRNPELPYFHTDACQAANYLNLNVQKLGVDLMTLNGSKIYGPKMSGMLYVKSGVRLKPIVFGGGQEKGLWSGTENVPGIVGFARALEIVEKLKSKEVARLTKLRDYFIGKLQNEIKGVVLNGDPARRLPNNIHISVSDVEGEVLVLYLDGVRVETAVGSACTAQSSKPSHVLTALGLSPKKARESLRMTLGRNTSKKNCDDVVEEMKKAIKLLRH
ncbi:MAG: cysteine desulfurase family protein [bacterium]|nr:cysteine desulfurase family protein [bacterium]